MEASDREEWQELMKVVMVLQEDIADVNKRIFELWKKVDEKLDKENKDDVVKRTSKGNDTEYS